MLLAGAKSVELLEDGRLVQREVAPRLAVNLEVRNAYVDDCRAAVENRGYCWNGRWVKLRYSSPYPYYFDSYLAYIANGGTIDPAAVGSCGPPHGIFGGAHGISRGGFGISACHTAHG